ncbi:uncharacterized protein TNCV_100631 [Trichonephila clavipes]|nr:uncharacterized protein TNCV_100631 [Trichonephila clavipes]
MIHNLKRSCGSPVVKVSDHGRHVMSSSPVPLKTRRVGQRCTLNLSRAETSSRWCGVETHRAEMHIKYVEAQTSTSWERGSQFRCPPRLLTMVQNDEVRRQKLSSSRTVER